MFDNPFEGHTRRQFCGFCGTPLTYWSEHPRTEADYIQITMGSLCREDLGDLEDMGLIPESPGEDQTLQLPSRGGAQEAPVTSTSTAVQPVVHRDTTSIPWFDSIVEGSSLGGRLRATKGTRHSADGATTIEWEIVEYNDDGGEEVSTPSSNNGKRKLGDRDDAGEDRMEDVSHS